MKKAFLFAAILSLSLHSNAQDEPEEETGGFKKENLFTGGSISLSFFNQAFLIGGNPVLGYSLNRWADAGIVINYTYTSYRDYQYLNDRLRQTVYGGGGFLRLFPVKFLFAQGQMEYNWIKLKYIPPPGGGGAGTNRVSATSLLVGGGYTSGRDPDSKGAYGYLAVLFDITKNKNSPYTDNLGRALPLIRAGFNIPLFQGSKYRD